MILRNICKNIYINIRLFLGTCL